MTIRHTARVCLGIILLFATGAKAYQDAPIGQIITVNTQFRDVLQNAALWVDMRDPNTGASKPFFMRLDASSGQSVFATHSNEYILNRVWLEFDDGRTLHPCQTDKNIITNRSTEIILSGILDNGFDKPRCHIKFVTSPPIQSALPHQVEKAQTSIQTDLPITTEEGHYYQAIKDCLPGAYRFTAYQPFVDEQTEILAVIEGQANDRCVVLQENNYTDPLKKSNTVTTRCQFTASTREKFTSENINKLLEASSTPETGKVTFYTKAMCDECSAQASGNKLKCFQKGGDNQAAVTSESTPATTRTSASTTATTG